MEGARCNEGACGRGGGACLCSKHTPGQDTEAKIFTASHWACFPVGARSALHFLSFIAFERYFFLGIFFSLQDEGAVISCLADVMVLGFFFSER